MKPTIFFDLDGTLTDPKVGITTCIRHALAIVGKSHPHDDNLEWCIGPPLLQSFEKLVGDVLAPKALLAYRERFSDVGWSENVVYDGIDLALEKLKKNDFQLFVATSKPHVFARKILNHFHLKQYFTEIFGAELDGTHGNKSDLLAYALSKTETNQQTSMVGDRSYDMIGALDNKLVPIGVSYGYGSIDELEGAGASTILHSTADIAKYFIR